MTELMSLDTEEATNADIQILNPTQLTTIRDQVINVEK